MTGEDRTTPRPWTKHKWHRRIIVAPPDVPPPGWRAQSVADCRYRNGEADAALIVEAVNNYDRLRAIEAAARAVMDVADYYADETETSPLWDDIPVELADKLVALRTALEGDTR